MFTGGMADFSPVELLELFQRAQNQFTDRVDAVAPDQWEDKSLPQWTVADLAHMNTNGMSWSSHPSPTRRPSVRLLPTSVGWAVKLPSAPPQYG